MQVALFVDIVISADSNDYEIDECSLSSLRFHLSKYVWFVSCYLKNGNKLHVHVIFPENKYTLVYR